jgi:hypothetical protein
MGNDQAEPVGRPALGHPEFFLWREVDRLDGRITQVDRRVGQLDEHGSRGVEALRGQLGQLGRDFEAHEKAHERAAAEQTTSRRWMIGIVVALVVPLYPLILVFFRPH